MKDNIINKSNTEPFIKVTNLTKIFNPGSFLGFNKKKTAAVNTVSFDVEPGDTIGLAGESGSGKSTLGKLIIGLLSPTRGSVKLNGIEVNKASKAQTKNIRKFARMIFQNLDAVLNPNMKIVQILAEPLKLYTEQDEGVISKKIIELLDEVNLLPNIKDKYPHELSGGQKRRISIARAIAYPPELLIADEPVSSLDATSSSQIINLIKEIKKEYELTLLLITHQIDIIPELCKNVMIMKNGSIIESGGIDIITDNNARHPFTQELINSTIKLS